MLAACAEIAALTLHIHGAYALGLIASLLLSMALCRRALAGLALPGALLCALAEDGKTKLYTATAETCALFAELPFKAKLLF